MEKELPSRVVDAKNRVFYSDGLGIGRNNPISLHTNSSSIYRVTGYGQIADIINCGYVRPKEGRIKGGHKDEVFWSLGGEKNFYYDKRPVLEISSNKVKNGQMGAVTLEKLNSIWIFDEFQDKYVDRIETIRLARDRVKKSTVELSVSDVEAILSKQSEMEYYSNSMNHQHKKPR